ncbi:MAG TPA: sulfotransferase domain-containing protein [Candidatus Limnocylindria bacterium]|nr:sulfotransferase domain-containing protein [Candidatus Limnocylindria bacterium]
MRRYHGFIADSDRWNRFTQRDDDVVITTPSKCGTTWMQTIVGMLLRQTTDLPPIGTIAPWIDMLIRSEDEAFGVLEAQTTRRFMKTHTPFDGIPYNPKVTYVAVIRHPLDVALSDRDHGLNMKEDNTRALREAVAGEYEKPQGQEDAPEEPAPFLRWFIDNDRGPTGSGPNGLADYCQQIGTYWNARDKPNVHLFHYQDMWNDLDAEMRRVAAALGVAIDEATWPSYVDAATLKSMRGRAAKAVPDGHLDIWKSPEEFFHAGGTREWTRLLTPAEIAHFDERLRELAGDSYDWIMRGKAALGG